MRNAFLSSLAALVVLSGCATFKELEPDPPLLPQERGYIELKNDKENFELSEGKCYFIKFPRPPQDHYILLVQTNAAWYIDAYLTRTFDDGKEPITRMKDEAPVTDSTSVFAVDPSSPTYFWVIDTVRQDVELKLKYRYVPRWRFTFENKYTEFKKTLASDRIDRSTYLCETGGQPIQSVDYRDALDGLKTRWSSLTAMRDELREVATLFPTDIAAANDTAYQNYKTFRSALEEEMQFQENYSTALTIFQKEKASRGNTGRFLEDAGEYTDFLSQRSKFPAPLLAQARESIGNRLHEVAPYYDQQMQGKREVQRITLKPPLDAVTQLYSACGRTVDPEFASLSSFVQRFNTEVDAVKSGTERLRELNAMVEKTTTPPPPSFYGTIEVTAKDIRGSLPVQQTAAHPRYGTLEAVQALSRDLAAATLQSEEMAGLFTLAGRISGDIGRHAWSSAEKGTADMFYGRDGGSYTTVAHHREKLVKWFEADIFSGVKGATKDRLDGFVKLSQASFANVSGLYADSAFMPAYLITFSSIGETDVMRKRAQIDDYINHVRHVEFPENAIRTLYADFTHDMNTYGVERARAIVEHGKQYKGTDKQISSILSECDPSVAKWIIRPKEYRRILAFPVTSNKRGANDYVFRIKLQIPSDAQFPVFDINVKLPREIAESGAGESWYDRITINNSPIKNEGRFRITAPLADNNYESQITPVQMDKAGNNILEIRFKKPTFKVYEISAMAQVPIMKKN
jgi:hypothetical protein